jgi:hypothetical protein
MTPIIPIQDADDDGFIDVNVIKIRPSTVLLFKAAEALAAMEAAKISIGQHRRISIAFAVLISCRSKALAFSANASPIRPRSPAE